MYQVESPWSTLSRSPAISSLACNTGLAQDAWAPSINRVYIALHCLETVTLLVSAVEVVQLVNRQSLQRQSLGDYTYLARPLS